MSSSSLVGSDFDEVPEDFPQQPQQQPEQQSQPQEMQLPKDISDMLEKYENVCSNPNDVDVLWDFVQYYLTFIENNSHMIIPIIKRYNENINENQNILLIFKNLGLKDVEWGIYNMFVTISNLGSKIMSRDNKDERDEYYLIYVMLTVNNESCIFNFTELLRNLMIQTDERLEKYNTLNTKFLNSFKDYERDGKKVSKEGFSQSIEKSIKLPFVNKNIKMKWIILVTVIIILLLISIFCYWNMNKSGKSNIMNISSNSKMRFRRDYGSDIDSGYSSTGSISE